MKFEDQAWEFKEAVNKGLLGSPVKIDAMHEEDGELKVTLRHLGYDELHLIDIFEKDGELMIRAEVFGSGEKQGVIIADTDFENGKYEVNDELLKFQDAYINTPESIEREKKRKNT